MLSLTNTTLGSGASPLGADVLRRLLQAVTLRPQPAAQSHIDCAVVRLPLKNGVATVDRSIALETDQLAVSAKGEVRFDDETLALAFRPTPKTALNINPLNLAQLVVLKGPWQDPKLALDAQGVAGMAASLGLAGATGGLSLLAQQLLKAAPEKDVCRTALSGVAPSPAAPTATADTGVSAQAAVEAAAGAARGLAQHLQVASGSAGASSRCSSWSSVSYTWASRSAPMRCSSSRYCASMRGTMRRASARLFGVIDTDTRRWSSAMRSRCTRPISSMRASTPVALALSSWQRSQICRGSSGDSSSSARSTRHCCSVRPCWLRMARKCDITPSRERSSSSARLRRLGA